MEDSEENRLEDEVLAWIQETAEVSESFEEFVSAYVDLMYFEELTDPAILAQVNGACALEGDPEEDDEDAVVAG